MTRPDSGPIMLINQSKGCLQGPELSFHGAIPLTIPSKAIKTALNEKESPYLRFLFFNSFISPPAHDSSITLSPF